MSVSGKRVLRLLMGMSCLVAILVSTLPSHDAYAAQITLRTLPLEAGPPAGVSKPGGFLTHLFSFPVPTTASIGSVQFQYCTTAAGTCTTPTGLVTTAATMGTQTGA